ncbi:hypothetical protein ACTWP6_06510 [Mycobacterium sp. 4D054]|uniref:hypothetical protein n=1 Tax=unclassified Mycobacterium TaxID=2642494 RepID=UPI0021B32100|nr:hypothetical protein [Mycobacterium sp. SMC-8]UXA12071.1 hypothetical protein KXD97_29840 [Mycobacterium sp. SMC-8]
MDLAFRSTLKLAVAVVGASSIALAPGVAPLPDLWHPQNQNFAAQYTVPQQTSLTLRAPDLQLAAAVEALLLDPTPTLVPTPGLVALANAIDNAYNVIEPWVRYGFEVASDVVAWIPWVGIFANQIMVVYNFVESLINSGVFNTTDWLRGQGSALKNVADWVVDLGLAVVWLGIDEVGAWIPLPPIGFYPPRPPAADLPEGFLGNAVVGASHLLADVSNAIWDIWEPIRGGIDWAVGVASDVLDAVSWIPFVPLINFEVTEGWDLIAGGIDALTGFAHDMIDAGDQFVTDTLQGDGLIAAIVNAFDNTVLSIATRTGEAWQAFVDWVDAQISLFLNPFGTTGTTTEETPQPSEGPADESDEQQSSARSMSPVEPTVTGAPARRLTVEGTDGAAVVEEGAAEENGADPLQASGADPTGQAPGPAEQATGADSQAPVVGDDEVVTLGPSDSADGIPEDAEGEAPDDVLGGALEDTDDPEASEASIGDADDALETAETEGDSETGEADDTDGAPSATDNSGGVSGDAQTSSGAQEAA